MLKKLKLFKTASLVTAGSCLCARPGIHHGGGGFCGVWGWSSQPPEANEGLGAKALAVGG